MQIVFGPREDDPLRRLLALGRLAGADGKVVAMKANQPRVIREIGDDWLEIESTIGNMESDKSAISQFLKVKVHRFPCE